MSPEQLAANRIPLDRRTDIYSLGVCLFLACTLERPFKSERPKLYEEIIQVEPPSPRRINPSVPPDLAAIILQAIDKNRDRRYQTMIALAEDLRRFRHFEPVEARPVGRVIKTMRWMQRNKTVTASAAVVTFALTAALSVFVLKERDTQRALTDRTEALRGMVQALASETQERKAKEIALHEKNEALHEKTIALETAERERNAKAKSLANYERLADMKRLETAIAASESLYPPSPALVRKIETWQEVHGSLAGKIAGHREFLAELRANALPYSENDKKNDFAAELVETRRLKAALADSEKVLATEGDENVRKPLLERRQKIEKRLAELETITTTIRRSWRFEDQALLFQHDVLAELVTGLESFACDETGPVKSAARWLAQSQLIANRTLDDDSAKERWVACRERIKRNANYRDLDLIPQLGLIPLGPDPDSGLEEFLHWLTHKGEIPIRDVTTGKLTVSDEFGIILVLVPGGTFLMGSQKDDPEKPNFSPYSQLIEQPVHEVKLVAYFLSKYEMNQSQWNRAFSKNPSLYRPGALSPQMRTPVSALHPVESISWSDAMIGLRRIGLTLPSEAQWERSARAGTSLNWSGTDDRSRLREFANINGVETTAVGWSNQESDHRDEFIIHAPVGSFSSNSYGLFDMSGNVYEWCLDEFIGGYTSISAGALRTPEIGAPIRRVNRGGSCTVVATAARVAFRSGDPAEAKGPYLGVRPCRPVTLQD